MAPTFGLHPTNSFQLTSSLMTLVPSGLASVRLTCVEGNTTGTTKVPPKGTLRATVSSAWAGHCGRHDALIMRAPTCTTATLVGGR
eukprot:4182339-Pyramimonas_sp.AAC.2